MGQVLPPTSFCANVDPAAGGFVFLSWDAPSPIGDVVSYTIYKFDGANYVPINTTFDENVLSYDDQTGNPFTDAQQYYIVSNGSDFSESDQVPISSMFLEVGRTNDFSIALLEWNTPLVPMPPGATTTIERKIDGVDLDYVAIETLTGVHVSYRDTLFGLCTPSDDIKIQVDYRIVLNHGTCTMYSNEARNEFKDKLPPDMPQIETVTIDPFTGDLTVYWYPISAPDLFRYLVQRWISPTVANNVGFVYPGEPTEFIYEDAPTSQASLMQVISFDDCGNDQSADTQVSSIYAQSSYQTCDTMAQIWWNPYEGWDFDQGVEKYRLHIEVDGGGFTVIDNLDPNEVVYDLEITPNSEYCIYVEAISNGTQRASTSNMTCFVAQYPEPAGFNYISRVSTVSDNEITIELLQDQNAQNITYELWRSVSGSSFRLMSTYDQTPEESIIVSDFDVDADIQVYTYYWKAYDGCGLELAESNRSNNIVLKAEPSNIGLANKLSWNAYEGWDGGVLGYDIYRKLGSETEFTLLQSVGPDVFNYREDVESFMLEEGLFCYKIVAIEGPNNFDKTEESISNEACATQEPLMWIPNAIVTNGFNNIFAPVAGFINFQSYQMEIRNKAGLILFETDKIEEGWDGTYNGRQIGEDYYMYTIVYRDGAGQNYVRQGVVYVIHAGAN
jgi:gliding motility-associated-like protein